MPTLITNTIINSITSVSLFSITLLINYSYEQFNLFLNLGVISKKVDLFILKCNYNRFTINDYNA